MRHVFLAGILLITLYGCGGDAEIARELEKEEGVRITTVQHKGEVWYVVWFSRTENTRDKMNRLGDMRRVATLVLEETDINGRGMRELGRLPRLLTLRIKAKEDIPADALGHIGNLIRLEELEVENCPSIVDVLARLTGLPLKRLILTSCGISDEMLSRFPTFPDIDLLGLGGNQITGGGLPHLVAKFPNVKDLHLRDNQITDSGLSHLQGLSDLTRLDLRGNPITDAGVGDLGNLKGLNRLDLRGTNVSDDGLKQLKQALPRCEILPTPPD